MKASLTKPRNIFATPPSPPPQSVNASVAIFQQKTKPIPPVVLLDATTNRAMSSKF